jgi:hypothetical protein
VIIDENAVRALRQEISDLVAADRKQRIRGALVGWEDRMQHDTRLARIQEIKEILEKLARGTK